VPGDVRKANAANSNIDVGAVADLQRYVRIIRHQLPTAEALLLPSNLAFYGIGRVLGVHAWALHCFDLLVFNFQLVFRPPVIAQSFTEFPIPTAASKAIGIVGMTQWFRVNR
jgi:hypothetical protein